MRLAKIKNKYMYETKPGDKGTHTYLVFFDRKKKRYNAAQLTHLYIKDNKRFVQVNKGLIKVEKFKEFDVPSGVKKHVYENNIYGGNINLKDRKNVRKVYSRYLSKKQSSRIKKFLK